MFLWDRRGGRPPNAVYPSTFDGLIEQGVAFAGTPAKVRASVEAQVERAGVNYLVCRFAFGDMGEHEALRSVELFAREIMPALRDEVVQPHYA